MKRVREIAAYQHLTASAKEAHVCTPQTCPRGNYYVTAADAGTFWKMSGPYRTHTAALADVGRALQIANRVDGRAWFMGWGTCRVKCGEVRPGKLNELKLMEIAEGGA